MKGKFLLPRGQIPFPFGADYRYSVTGVDRGAVRACKPRGNFLREDQYGFTSLLFARSGGAPLFRALTGSVWPS